MNIDREKELFSQIEGLRSELEADYEQLDRLRLKIAEKTGIGCPFDVKVIVTWAIALIDGPEKQDDRTT